MATLKEGEKCAVLLVDDHEAFRQELRRLLTKHEEIDVVGAVGDGSQALNFLSSCQPHVILLDLKMPRMNGIELAGLIKQSWPDIAIIGLCMMQDAFTMGAFLRAGATAVISKSENPEGLYSVIQRASPRRPAAAK
jgi:DNA-binding NarL/FixJ family response regulator